jgi:iron only hydrogenase large subunit-like protein
MKYYHAHRVDLDKCQGRMACMRYCPTQAIRVKNEKAVISEELCVDCGTCFSVCKSRAILEITDPIVNSSRYKCKVAVPSSVLYSQFDASIHPYIIHLALKKLGFDRVVDVHRSASGLKRALFKYMETYQGRRPLISSHCPALVRMIQVKYPDLVELVAPLDVPREVTAREIKKQLPQELGLNPDDIGITFIAPCPAMIVSIKQPAEKERSWFDEAVSLREVYSVLLPHVRTIKDTFDENQVPEDFVFNRGWARLGSIAESVEMESWLAVAGLQHVKQTLDDIESSRLSHIDYVEAMTCRQGCLGGPFCVESPYVARANSINQKNKYEKTIEFDDKEITEKLRDKFYYLANPILPRPMKFFDTDLETSIKRMREKETVYQKLKQIDCGCCGAPTCMSFAEDFVRGEAEITDCIFITQELEE